MKKGMIKKLAGFTFALAALFALICAVQLNANAQSISFNRVLYAAAGDSAYQTATGDLNGDGKLDLVVVNESGTGGSLIGTVSIFLGNGDGTFQAHFDYPVGQRAEFLTIADVNGDGRLDIVASNYEANSVSVLLGNGNGTFQPQVAFPSVLHSCAVTAAKLTSSGKVDLVVYLHQGRLARSKRLTQREVEEAADLDQFKVLIIFIIVRVFLVIALDQIVLGCTIIVPVIIER